MPCDNRDGATRCSRPLELYGITKFTTITHRHGIFRDVFTVTELGPTLHSTHNRSYLLKTLLKTLNATNVTMN